MLLGIKVLIDYDGNFYDGMTGDIVEDSPHTVIVKINFGGDYHEVEFYKTQVKLAD